MLKGVHEKLIAVLGLDDGATLHQCLCKLDSLTAQQRDV